MCGISGIVGKKSEISTAEYVKAHSTMSHRGPDDEGFVTFVNGAYLPMRGSNTDRRLYETLPSISHQTSLPVVLGHHRLSILDLSVNGHQPFILGKFAMVYNGEIYNYIEIREELKKLGHSFITESDTEVVLKAYVEWGDDCFNRFNGMWALAIYDHTENVLVLSRDRYGVKPLYFSHTGGTVAFASEVSFFNTLCKRKLNTNTVHLYLYGNRQDCNTESFYEGVEQILPAHIYKFKDDRILVKERYWDFPKEKIVPSAEEALEELATIFRSAIELRLRSNVPVGCLLSGGLDSTLIASVMAAESDDQEVNTYSAVYDDPQFSEEGYIRETIKKYPKLNASFVKVRGEDFLADKEVFFKTQAGPVRSLAVYAQYKLYQRIASENKVTVLLNGQGSDECWGGYHNHYVHYFIGLLLRGDLAQLRREVELYAKNRNVTASELYRTILRSMASELAPSAIKNLLKGSQIKNDRAAALTLENKLKENFNYSALKEYLGYEDRNSMAFGRESRLPFLDYRLVEFSFKLGDQFKIYNFENKKLVRDLSRRYIPATISNRKDKMGFVTPQELWQKSSLKEEMIKGISQADRILGDSTFEIRKRVKDYFSGHNNDWALAWRYYNYLDWSARVS